MTSGAFMYPHVTSLPSQPGASSASDGIKGGNKRQEGVPTEFDRVFDKTLSEGHLAAEPPDLNQVRSPLKFSAHASQRLRDRKITLDPAMLSKINDAVDRAESKGVQDTLVLTPDAALIVNVTNKTVVTAMDRKSSLGNIFTNIDGAVIV